MKMRNAMFWVEIPVKNFERAKTFYEVIFNIEMKLVPFPRGKYATFPLDLQALGGGGAIVEGN
ncbi:MAG: VOC family protein, partial [Saprospiraceae bacterium]